MHRIMIIGCCGAGKSTLARKMHAILDVELIHLDQCYFQANWVEPDKAEWAKTVEALAEKPSWIIDGNYGGTMDIRIEKADTIVYLNYPTLKCLCRVIKRTLKDWGKVRPDMAEGCKERFDFEFLHYVATFNITRGKKLLKKLKKLEKTKQVFILNNDRATEKFIDSLTKP